MFNNDEFLEGMKKQVENEGKDMEIRVVQDKLWCFFNQQVEISGVKFGANFRKSNSFVGVGGGLPGCNYDDIISSSSPLFHQDLQPGNSPLTGLQTQATQLFNADTQNIDQANPQEALNSDT